MQLDHPPITDVSLFSDAERIVRAARILPLPEQIGHEYRPWRKVRPIARQLGLDPLDTWAAVKLARIGAKRELPVVQIDNRPFAINVGNHLLEPLHRVDRATGGGGPADVESPDGLLFDEAHRSRLVIRTLMDEAAESSIMEGAATTRREAIEMLRQQAPPKTKGERMVHNNYLAMQTIKRQLDRPLSPEMLLELQSVLTKETLDEPGQAGRFRKPSEPVRVVSVADNTDIFQPPPAELLPARVKALCDFANCPHVGADFIHPLVKACVLHFMIGYEHPFVDGNGRTARTIFYWHALRSGYRIFEYMPISDRIRVSPSRYTHAYLDTELDEGDLTYFVLYHLDVIEQALEHFSVRLREERDRLDQSLRMLKFDRNLNPRQRLLLEHAIRHPHTSYTVRSHRNSNGITLNTARADLSRLVTLRLLTTAKRGREVVYMASQKLAEKVAQRRNRK